MSPSSYSIYPRKITTFPKPPTPPPSLISHTPLLPSPLTTQLTPFLPGNSPGTPIYVAIKGIVFDVSKNKAYQPGGAYHVFAGKDPSRALASSSLKPEECVPDWYDLEDEKKTVLADWFKFFSKRYNIVGKVSANL